MFLDKIQSGFLLFETSQGFTRIELSPRQRVTLLWTFRNFRQLSVPLLSPRERELVNSLFHHSAPIVFDDQDPSRVIGVVENYVPATPRIGVAPVKKPVAPKKLEPNIIVAAADIAAKARSAPSLMPLAPERAMVAASPTELATPAITLVRRTKSKRKTARLATSRLATGLTALCLCVGSVAMWHRIQGLPVSEAYTRSQVQQSSGNAAPSSPSAGESETRSEVPVVQSASGVASPDIAAPKAAFRHAAITAVVPTPSPAPVGSRVSTSKPAIPGRDLAGTTKLPLSADDSSIQASRPPLHFVYPDYSYVHARGVVSLKAGLDSAGNVRTVKLISGNRALAAAALRAVRKWRYRPYLKDGEPVATETYIVISFISEDAVSMTFPPSISTTR